MLLGRVSNPGPLTYESGAQPIALRGPAVYNGVYNGEKSYVDRLAARKLRDFKLFITSHEFLIDQNDFYRTFYRLFHSI